MTDAIVPILTVVIPTAHRDQDRPKQIITSLRQDPYLNSLLEFIVIGDDRESNLNGGGSWDALERHFISEHFDPGCKRNIGIANSKGEYITFVDADDLVNSLSYHHVVNLIRRNPDLIISNYDVIVKGETIYSSQLPKIDVTKIWEADKLWREITWDDFKLIAPGNSPAYRLIIKNSLLKLTDVRFPCGVLGEDQVFAQRVLSEAQTLCFLSTKTYVHQPNQIGLSQTKSHKAFKDLVTNLQIINQEALNVQNANLKRLLLLSSEFFKLKMLVACSNPKILLLSELQLGTKIKSISVIITNYCKSKSFLLYGKLPQSIHLLYRYVRSLSK